MQDLLKIKFTWLGTVPEDWMHSEGLVKKRISSFNNLGIFHFCDSRFWPLRKKPWIHLFELFLLRFCCTFSSFSTFYIVSEIREIMFSLTIYYVFDVYFRIFRYLMYNIEICNNIFLLKSSLIQCNCKTLFCIKLFWSFSR